jgi:uncharacterized iron-regulated membrane protein
MAGATLRRLSFQLHLWTGLIAGLYIIVVSVTGSAVVFRREIARRLLADAGNGPYPAELVLLDRIVSLHADLWLEDTGRLINGIGGLACGILCVTGAIIWWRGRRNWYRGMIVKRGVRWRTALFDWHSALGFWTFFFLSVWAITGLYFAWPDPFTAAVDYFEPLRDDGFDERTGDQIIAWLVRMHFGRFGGLGVRITWTLAGLVPPVLFITGAMMWWKRGQSVKTSSAVGRKASQVR